MLSELKQIERDLSDLADQIAREDEWDYHVRSIDGLRHLARRIGVEVERQKLAVIAGSKAA